MDRKIAGVWKKKHYPIGETYKWTLETLRVPNVPLIDKFSKPSSDITVSVRGLSSKTIKIVKYHCDDPECTWAVVEVDGRYYPKKYIDIRNLRRVEILPKNLFSI